MRDWLKEIRKNENLTMLQTAIKAEISESYYCLIENGERDPHQKTAKSIAEVLNFNKYGLGWSRFFEGNVS